MTLEEGVHVKLWYLDISLRALQQTTERCAAAAIVLN